MEPIEWPMKEEPECYTCSDQGCHICRPGPIQTAIRRLAARILRPRRMEEPF